MCPPFDQVHQFKLKIRDSIRNEPQWCHTLKVARRACIYTSGEQDGMVYSIDCGQVKLMLSTPEGRECVLEILNAGDVFGELCLSGQLTRVETAVAIQDSRLSAMSHLSLLKILSGGTLLDGLARYLAGCIARQEEFIASMLTVNSEQRLAKVLLHLGAAQGAENPHGITIRPRILYEDLAAMVGTTRSRIGVFIKHFQKRGLLEINTDHSLTIQAEKLQEFTVKSAFTENAKAGPCRVRLQLTSPSSQLEVFKK